MFARLIPFLLIAPALAGCVTASVPAPRNGATLAFESVDGPPPDVFNRLVGALETESQARGIAVVSREGPAAYRVRSYLAAQTDKSRTSVAWVWDVYDQGNRRTLRLSGEETVRTASRDAWTGADDAILQRIAQAGFTGLAPLLDGRAPAEAGQPPASNQAAPPNIAALPTSENALAYAPR